MMGGVIFLGDPAGRNQKSSPPIQPVYNRFFLRRYRSVWLPRLPTCQLAIVLCVLPNVHRWVAVSRRDIEAVRVEFGGEELSKNFNGAFRLMNAKWSEPAVNGRPVHDYADAQVLKIFLGLTAWRLTACQPLLLGHSNTQRLVICLLGIPSEWALVEKQGPADLVGLELGAVP
ncbi:hypothetical protein VTN77DRAFT_1225 [Rasamsonia byssochlamydoides]|uniref:uncharacterized protein n=1 Tax=Rasamsonia byssochlamydoides TaxID=89139 RepID=UPI003741EDD2